MTTRVLQPGEIEALAPSEIPFLRLPDKATLFSQRAERLLALAEQHSARAYLRFIAAVAAAQQRALSRYPAVALPDAEQLARARAHAMPPLGALGLKRDSSWREILRAIVADVRDNANDATRRVLDQLDRLAAEALEAQATALLSGELEHVHLGAAPLIGAALQVHWLRLATQLGETAFARIDPAHLCPVCGSRPVASIARIGGQEGGYRYLHCSLCAAEWHMVRIKCTYCESTKGIAYHHVEGGAQAIKAETCDECKTYLKILYMEKDPLLEPTADDLATLPLDLLVGELGFLRSGPNLMLLHGAES